MTEEKPQIGVCDLCGHEVEWMGKNIQCENDYHDEDNNLCDGIYQLKDEED